MTRHAPMTRDGCMRDGVHLRLVERADGNAQAAGGEGDSEGSVEKGVSVGLWRTKRVEGDKRP
jgi:hypothetical protein